MTTTKGYRYCRVQDFWNGKSSAQPWDILFFNNAGEKTHIGIITEVAEDHSYFKTVEGNTNGQYSVDGIGTPGGGVCEQKYKPTTRYTKLQNGYIVHPNYD